jgi:hypothetical protein
LLLLWVEVKYEGGYPKHAPQDRKIKVPIPTMISLWEMQLESCQLILSNWHCGHVGLVQKFDQGRITILLEDCDKHMLFDNTLNARDAIDILLVHKEKGCSIMAS